MQNMTAILQGEVLNITGQRVDLSQYAGQVVLVVNTASACGFTPQYQGLEQLYQRYKEQGLVILGFPCNQFGAQEQGSADQISSFCQLNYGVSFPLFAKVDVNGPQALPLFTELKNAKPGLLGTKAIKWNFTKFLIGRDGQVLMRAAPVTKPEALEAAIVQALAKH